MNACENILRLSRELGVHRRLLYKWRDQVDPADADGEVTLPNSRESTLRKEISKLKRLLADKTRCVPGEQVDVGANARRWPSDPYRYVTYIPARKGCLQESPSPVIRAGHMTSTGLPCHIDRAIRPIYRDRGLRCVALAAWRNLLPKAGKIRGERYPGAKELICRVGEKEHRRNSDGRRNKAHEAAGPRSNPRHNTPYTSSMAGLGRSLCSRVTRSAGSGYSSA